MFVSTETILRLGPEIALIVMASLIYVGGAFWPGRRTSWASFATATYLLVGYMLVREDRRLAASFEAAAVSWTGPLVVDALGQMVRWLALAMGLLFTLSAFHTASRRLASEYLGSLMLVVAGVMLVGGANELVFLFVSLELVTIPTYVLLFLGRRDRPSAEATAKYFYLSILASALLLYGFAFLYGLAGTTTIAGDGTVAGIREALTAPTGKQVALSGLAPLAIVFVFAGLGFKIAAAPFHFYAPDVYQGTTNANAGLLAVAPKIAGIVALMRIVAAGVPTGGSFAWQLTVVFAVLTMTIGNVSALWQTHLRRLMAYSSIAHAGYMLIGLAVGLTGDGGGAYQGLAATMFYLLVYSLASIGAFSALAYLSTEERECDGIDDLAGLGRERPAVAASLALCMFSLSGLPPLAGFWGKLTLFTGSVQLAGVTRTTDLWFLALSLVGAINAAIGAAYYLRIVGVMYFRPASAPARATGNGSLLAAVACGIAVLLLGANPGPLVARAGLAAQSLRSKAAETARTVDEPAADATAELAR